MEEKQQDLTEQALHAQEAAEEKAVYTPRPLWQRITAWIALMLFIAVILMYYINIMRGGM